MRTIIRDSPRWGGRGASTARPGPPGRLDGNGFSPRQEAGAARRGAHGRPGAARVEAVRLGPLPATLVGGAGRRRAVRFASTRPDWGHGGTVTMGSAIASLALAIAAGS